MNENISDWFKTNKERINTLKQEFWNNPETAYKEYKCCELTKDFLLENGFTDVKTVALDLAGKNVEKLPNTVIAKWGSGKPVIGLLGELDALPGLGQEAVPYYSPKEGNGQGCGHCLIATAGVTSAVALKSAMEKENITGTICYIACPAEEDLSGKAILAREGYFDELDFAYMYHPFGRNMRFDKDVWSAITTMEFNFTGKSAHAAAMPWDGRSALDAAELMNVGVQYLREHVTQDVRIHYVYRNGGMAPNIVPDKASLYYFIRSREENMEDILKRVEACAEGAATMTGTKAEWHIEGGCHSYHGNRVLAHTGYDIASAMSAIEYTDEEYEYAAKIQEAQSGKRGTDKDDILPRGVDEPDETEKYDGGSTDVGDLAMKCPTYQFSGFGAAVGLPLHNWSIVACVGTDIGLKAAMFAGEAMAQSALEVAKKPEILKAAWEEFHEDYKTLYKCIIPKDN